ncbi:MAG TPA: sugar phosphate isomerase/epimerase [Symbiobacteriaceae bacterium]|nr:sugar phosphate isomerase/epimerase [Symbiobacteriaceae bacterium]
MAHFDVAVHLITWGSDWRQGLADVSALGFKGCETFTWVAEQHYERQQQFKEILAEHRLRLVALYAGGRLCDPAVTEQEIAWNGKVARFLRNMGADRMVLGGGVRRPEGNSREDWQLFVHTMHEIGRICNDLGIKACYHPHLGTIVEKPDEIDRVMEMTDPGLIWLAADCAHIQKGGADPCEVYRKYRDRLAYLHIKDLNPGVEWGQQTSAGTDQLPIFTELGRGVVDLKACIATLREIDYQGWITVELDQSVIGPMNSLRINKEYLENELGLTV